MASARALMDLNAEHGTSELKEGMRFSSGTDATYFMQDYTYNANTRCCVKSSGTMKTYTCSHDKKAKPKGAVSNDEGETTVISSVDDRSIPGDVCGWEVRVSMKRERGGPQLFWVSYINDLHSDLCTSTAKVTKRQLTKLATLRAAVLGDRKVKGKALVAMLQSRDGVNMQFSRSRYIVLKTLSSILLMMLLHVRHVEVMELRVTLPARMAF
ncbi:hypothetical protein PHYSODRAFT_321079 [Phytophthora sojae]|uniref:Uncharacterized protein n=1 Tax=Phytophthora sojae (strain P6497) TaxID=1094619 RepID=G4YPB3_PHYSP|nr:hypothetical protein PHYSODRAFT_321079 [Phytophthora sojae]EGZ27247.1 hypothetical protein PHYSODRAFT_321079 [Phytophthora sojae]|eukprot:XP_009514522.1 hypothetical protein PHYSODRAFT_321079 [Phytophthora sojae]